jgi:hypothetical protein
VVRSEGIELQLHGPLPLRKLWANQSSLVRCRFDIDTSGDKSHITRGPFRSRLARVSYHQGEIR